MASRYSTPRPDPGMRCVSSRTRSRRTSTCSACSSPTPSGPARSPHATSSPQLARIRPGVSTGPRTDPDSPDSDHGAMSNLNVTPVTGTQYDISAGDYQATVTELGGGLRRLTHLGQPVITGYEPDELPPAGAGQLLAPWPNRIDHGRYEFDGSSFQLELSEAARGNAIHGLTRWANWEPVGHTSDEITLAHVLHGRP